MLDAENSSFLRMTNLFIYPFVILNVVKNLLRSSE